MLYILMGLMAVLITVADQLTKYFTVKGIPLFGHVGAVDGLFHFTYVQNTGAAFSSFEGMLWLFGLIFGLFTVAIIWEFWKKTMGFTTFERWCIVAIWAGGLGNMIDRVRLGYVVDMICLDFMKFPCSMWRISLSPAAVSCCWCIWCFSTGLSGRMKRNDPLRGYPRGTAGCLFGAQR